MKTENKSINEWFEKIGVTSNERLELVVEPTGRAWIGSDGEPASLCYDWDTALDAPSVEKLGRLCAVDLECMQNDVSLGDDE